VTFHEVVDQVVALVRTRQRLSYRALTREFDLDEEYLEDLKEELRFSHPEIADEDGRGLVWTGERAVVSSQHSVVSSPSILTPQSRTPSPQNPTPKPQVSSLKAQMGRSGRQRSVF